MCREQSAGVVAVQGSQASLAVRHLQLLLNRNGERVLSHAPDVGASSVSVQDWDISPRYFGQQEHRRSDAMQDQMIGVENLTAFTACLDNELARGHRTNERLALLVAEVGLPAGDDGTLGRDVVERVRIAMAQRLRLAVGASDTVMRVNTESFAIICRSICGWPALSLLLERLHTLDREPVGLSGEDVWGAVSVGAIFADEVGHGQVSARALLRHVGLWDGTTGL